MIRTAIIGCGHIATRHVKGYAAAQNAELVCVVDVDRARADAFAGQHGVKAYYAVADMIANESIDAVSVCTKGVENGSDHLAPTMECLEAGIHVLCEKPLSNRLDECEQMVARAKEKGLCLACNLNHRFIPAAFEARKWVDEGRLGELLFINMTLWIGNPNDATPYFHLRALHPHSVDVMRYFGGDVTEVAAFLLQPSHRKSWSSASILLRFASGALGHLTGSYDIAWGHGIERCEVAGIDGRFVIEDVTKELIWYPAGSPEETIVRWPGGITDWEQSITIRIRKWLDQLEGGAAPDEIDASGEDALKAQRIIEAAIQSHETGAVVKL
jgi:UDP-N-acetylglucosamine 3-dehydrogenase